MSFSNLLLQHKQQKFHEAVPRSQKIDFTYGCHGYYTPQTCQSCSGNPQTCQYYECGYCCEVLGTLKPNRWAFPGF